MTSQEICRVLDVGRGDPTNNETGKPIARSTLWRYFRNELISDHSLLRAEIVGRWRAALKNGWAVEAGLRNKCGWDPGRYGGLIGSPDDGGINPTVQIEFVMPSGNRLPELEYDRPIDPTQKRLPPPLPRIDTPFGVLEDRDPPATPEAEMWCDPTTGTWNAAVANEGARPQPHAIDSIEVGGRTIYQYPNTPPPTIGAAADHTSFYQLKTMLQGVVARGTARAIGALSPYVAGKTGTTEDSVDGCSSALPMT